MIRLTHLIEFGIVVTCFNIPTTFNLSHFCNILGINIVTTNKNTPNELRKIHLKTVLMNIGLS